MSFRYYPAAWELSIERGLTATQRLVLLAVVDRAGDDGACWPSQARLAEDTAYTDKTVRTALKALEGEGFLKRQHRMKPGQGWTSDLITLLFEPIAKRDSTRTKREVAEGGGTAAPVPAEGGTEEPRSETSTKREVEVVRSRVLEDSRGRGAACQAEQLLKELGEVDEDVLRAEDALIARCQLEVDEGRATWVD